MNPTKNDISEASRSKVIALCNERLADAIDLQTQCKFAHWNVKGANFIALHELFDKVNEDVEDYIDLIAERAVQLRRGRRNSAYCSEAFELNRILRRDNQRPRSRRGALFSACILRKIGPPRNRRQQRVQ